MTLIVKMEIVEDYPRDLELQEQRPEGHVALWMELEGEDKLFMLRNCPGLCGRGVDLCYRTLM